MNFASAGFFAIALLLAPILWLASKRRGTLGHSQVSLHNRVGGVPLLGRLPTVLFVSFWLVLVATLAGPQLTEWTQKQPYRREISCSTSTSPGPWTRS